MTLLVSHAVACPFMYGGGQTLLEQLRIVTGDLVVEPGAGESKDVNGGGRGMLPAWALGGQRLGLAGSVTGRHRPDQEAGRIDERRAACRPGPVDDPGPSRTQEDVQRVEVGVQQRIAVQQVQVGLAVDVRGPALPGLFDWQVRAADRR